MKRKKNTTANIENPIFVELQDPVSIRKNVLSGAIECIDLLKSYELSKSMRGIKEKQRTEVKRIISSLKKDYKELKDSLPNTNKKDILNITDPLSPPRVKEEPLKEERHKTRNEEKAEKMPAGLKRLEKELENIKGRLESL